MSSSGSESLDSRTVETDQDSADERTWLLADHTTKCCSEHASTSKTFGVWQFGALVARFVSAARSEIAEPADVAVLRSYVNIASTIGLSGGGPLGGFLAGLIGWRWLFLGQVPIAIACGSLIALGANVMWPEPVREDEQLQQFENENTPASLAFDIPGAVTLAIATSSLLAAVDLQASLPWRHPVVFGLIIVGILSTLAFLAFETFPGNRELLMPLKLLRAEIGAFCAGQVLGILSTLWTLPPTLSLVPKPAPHQLLASSLGYGFVSQIAPSIAPESKSAPDPRVKPGVMHRDHELTTGWNLVLGAAEGVLTTFPFGLLGGIILSAQFIGLYHCSARENVVTSISMYYMSQQIGIALGIGISSGLLKHQLKLTLSKDMANIPGSAEIIKKILDDSSAIIQFPEEIQLLARQAYVHSFWVVPLFALSAQIVTILPMTSTVEQYSG
ncbi:hypothetical protein PWT90_10671 [Aphanocladium album]|nr:hypothetical protein PWT90_10671 [Aphanocladium album]